MGVDIVDFNNFLKYHLEKCESYEEKETFLRATRLVMMLNRSYKEEHKVALELYKTIVELENNQ